MHLIWSFQRDTCYRSPCLLSLVCSFSKLCFSSIQLTHYLILINFNRNVKLALLLLKTKELILEDINLNLLVISQESLLLVIVQRNWLTPIVHHLSLSNNSLRSYAKQIPMRSLWLENAIDVISLAMLF